MTCTRCHRSPAQRDRRRCESCTDYANGYMRGRRVGQQRHPKTYRKRLPLVTFNAKGWSTAR